MSLIEHYRQVQATSDSMLSAALNGDWDSLRDAQRECARCIELLRRRTLQTPSDEEARRKNELIRHVLRNDARIRALSEPWLARFASSTLEGQRANAQRTL